MKFLTSIVLSTLALGALLPLSDGTAQVLSEDGECRWELKISKGKKSKPAKPERLACEPLDRRRSLKGGKSKPRSVVYFDFECGCIHAAGLCLEQNEDGSVTMELCEEGNDLQTWFLIPLAGSAAVLVENKASTDCVERNLDTGLLFAATCDIDNQAQTFLEPENAFYILT